MTSDQALAVALVLLERERKRLTADAVSFEQVSYDDTFRLFKSAHKRREKYTAAIQRLEIMRASEKQGVLF